MNKLFDKIARLAVSALMVGTMLPTCTTTIAAAGVTDLGTFVNPTANNLNSVLDYGVFANVYTQKNDMESNFAAANLIPSGDSLGNSGNTDWSEDSANNFNYIGSISKDFSKLKFRDASGDSAPILLLGDSIDITRNFNNGTGYELVNSDGAKADYNSLSQLGAKAVYNISSTTYVIDFAKAFAGMKEYSAAKYAAANTSGTKIGMTTSEIDITCVEGENIVSLSASDLASSNLHVSGLNGITNYSLILNVTGATGDVNFSNTVEINGKRDAYGYESGTLLYNFGADYTGTATFSGQATLGSVVAPSGSVVVTSSHNGSIFANSVENNGCEIHQSRFNSPIAQISLSKKLDDAAPTTEKFNFVLEDGTLDANGQYQSLGTSKTIQNNGGSIDTTRVYKYSEGMSSTSNYYYRMYESPDQILDKTQYTFDSTSYYIKVTVNFANKTATASYYSDAAFQNEVTNPTFNNYTGKPTGSLKVTKNISGTAASTDDTFKFQITLGDTTVTGKYGNVTFTNGVAVITLKGGDSVTATDLPLTSYEVEETDSKGYFISEKSGDTGTIVKDRTSEAIFTNTKNKTIPTSVVLQATKSFTGRTWTTDDNFVIDLLDADGKTVIDHQTATAAKPNVTFAAQDYTEAGEHTYYIAEELPTVDGQTVSKLNGITYDTTKVKVTVKVTEDAKTGTLSSDVKYGEGTTAPTFHNTYEVTGTSAELAATKSFTGRTWTTDDNFVIDLLDADGKTVIDHQTATAAKPNVTFAAQDYTEAGEHTYYIAEELPTVDGQTVSKLNGITYDTTKVKVTVKVTEDAKTGTLSSDVKYGEGTTAPTFHNTYEVTGTSAELAATKSFTGRTWTTDDNFVIDLLDADGKTVIDHQTATAAKPNVTFAAQDYTEAGEHTYYIAEELPTVDGQTVSKLNGITYDTTKVKVTVKVTEDAKTGTLSSDVKYGEGTTAPTFHNTYEVTGTSAELAATKSFTGRTWTTDDNFVIDLLDADGKTVIDHQTATAANQMLLSQRRIIQRQASIRITSPRNFQL